MISILKRICNYFDSSKLTKDLTFVGIGVIGIFISWVSAAAISNSFNGELTQCYTPQCFDNLLSWFSFPLKTLTATAAIMGIVAMVHRSKQTANQIDLSIKQITITAKQNMYLNYFSHIKNFKEEIASLEIEHLKLINDNRLYKLIFEENTPNNFSPNGSIEPILEQIKNLLKRKSRSESKYEKSINALRTSEDILNQRQILDIHNLHNETFINLRNLFFSLGYSINYQSEVILHNYKLPKTIAVNFDTNNLELPNINIYQSIRGYLLTITSKAIELSLQPHRSSFSYLSPYIFQIECTLDQLEVQNKEIRKWVEMYISMDTILSDINNKTPQI